MIITFFTYTLICINLLAFGYLLATFINQFFIVLAFTRNYSEIMKKECSFLETYSHKPHDLPQVAIQLPIYNESTTIKNLIISAIEQNYPIEKLEIQVLDDSTDETTEIVRNLVKQYSQLGFNIKHIQRPSRIEFKAGALQYGMSQSNADFFTVFDADFIPDKNFLLTLIPYFKDPSLGFIQTQWGLHQSQPTSYITHYQKKFVLICQTVSQTIKSQYHFLINFNGSAGILRKEAIIASGGWKGDTLSEDWDLSYRMQLNGWKGKTLLSVATPSEYPSSMNVLKKQQYRWSKGITQAALKLTPSILSAPKLSWLQKYQAILDVSSGLFFPALLGLRLTWLIYTLLLIYSFPKFAGLSFYYFMFSSNLLLLTIAACIDKLTNRYFKEHLSLLHNILTVITLEALIINCTIAVIAGMFGFKNNFMRTPKLGLTNLFVQKKLNPMGYIKQLCQFDAVKWVELIFVVPVIVSIIIALQHGYWLLSLLSIPFVFGLLISILL